MGKPRKGKTATNKSIDFLKDKVKKDLYKLRYLNGPFKLVAQSPDFTRIPFIESEFCSRSLTLFVCF